MFEPISKTETLFNRDKETFVVDPNDLRNPVYGIIKSWVVTEKVDGTSMRVAIDSENNIHIGGKSDKAQIPADLYEYMYKTFTPERMANLRREGDETAEITLYGEGYGAGIQKGGYYRPDKSFILFDVKVGDRFWLPDTDVTDIASSVGIDRVPIIGEMTLEEIVALCRDGFTSWVAQEPHAAEGIVARTVQPLYDQRGHRLLMKLKTCDFKPGKR